jgi:hypothetical protein
MNKKEVPQDNGVLDHWHNIQYAVDENGKYTLVPSSGWEPSNIANYQAWGIIEERLSQVIETVNAYKLSPLAYHMEKNLMDVALLTKYVRISRWRVKRHLRPDVFRRLPLNVLERYAKLFNISIEELQKVP